MLVPSDPLGMLFAVELKQPQLLHTANANWRLPARRLSQAAQSYDPTLAQRGSGCQDLLCLKLCSICIRFGVSRATHTLMPKRRLRFKAMTYLTAGRVATVVPVRKVQWLGSPSTLSSCPCVRPCICTAFSDALTHAELLLLTKIPCIASNGMHYCSFSAFFSFLVPLIDRHCRL